MSMVPRTAARPSTLRCVFSEAVMSFSLGGEATLADIAGLLEDVTPGRHGMPLLIDIAWLEVGLATPARDRASPDQPGLAA